MKRTLTSLALAVVIGGGMLATPAQAMTEQEFITTPTGVNDTVSLDFYVMDYLILRPVTNDKLYGGHYEPGSLRFTANNSKSLDIGATEFRIDDNGEIRMYHERGKAYTYGGTVDISYRSTKSMKDVESMDSSLGGTVTHTIYSTINYESLTTEYYDAAVDEFNTDFEGGFDSPMPPTQIDYGTPTDTTPPADTTPVDTDTDAPKAPISGSDAVTTPEPANTDETAAKPSDTTPAPVKQDPANTSDSTDKAATSDSNEPRLGTAVKTPEAVKPSPQPVLDQDQKKNSGSDKSVSNEVIDSKPLPIADNTKQIAKPSTVSNVAGANDANELETSKVAVTNTGSNASLLLAAGVSVLSAFAAFALIMWRRSRITE